MWVLVLDEEDSYLFLCLEITLHAANIPLILEDYLAAEMSQARTRTKRSFFRPTPHLQTSRSSYSLPYQLNLQVDFNHLAK